jgi:hypothetical protein
MLSRVSLETIAKILFTIQAVMRCFRPQAQFRSRYAQQKADLAGTDSRRHVGAVSFLAGDDAWLGSRLGAFVPYLRIWRARSK